MTKDPRFDQLIAAGLAASQEGRAQAALDLFGDASALAPSSGIPHFLAGSEHAAAGNIEAAEAAFANAVLLAPEFALARYQLGLLQFSSARAALALVTWQPLLSLPGADGVPHFVRGFTALAQDQFAAALEHFRAGLACPETNPAVCADIARVVESVQRLEQQRGQQAGATDDGAGAHVLLGAYSRGLH